MIEFKDITEDNFEQVLQLELAADQTKFVASNLRSLADAWLYRANGDVFPRAIYAGDSLVGFLLLEIDEEESTYLIWRMMIDQVHQGKGYGRAVVEALIEEARRAGFNTVRADCVKENSVMAKLLEHLAFQSIGQDDREIWTALSLRNS